MSIAGLAGFLSTVRQDKDRWRLVAEFLEEYHHEPADTKHALLQETPHPTGEEHWDVFLAALAEHLSAAEGTAGPAWTHGRTLRSFWFPFDTPAARADALVHAPAAFRRRGILVAPQELAVR